MAQRYGLSECGESSTADKSAVEKAGASSRTPKIAVARPYRLFGVTAGGIAREAARGVQSEPFQSASNER